MEAIKIQSRTPKPRENERPVAYADRVGRSYASVVSTTHKRSFGQYLTPVEVADFMAKLCRPVGTRIRALDPGAGAGILSCALCEASASWPHKPEEITLEAYEADASLADYLQASLSYSRTWLQARGITLKFEIHTDDFILTHAEALDDSPRLFPTKPGQKTDFDLVISNPPYFKLPKSDPRAQAAAAVVHGQPNIYAIFMAIAAALLKPQGQFVCITPRSFTAGPYFHLFRKRFFAIMQPKAVHLFDSRREAFGRDEVLQENIILLAQRVDHWPAQPGNEMVEVSVSTGADDLSQLSKRQVPLAEVLDPRSKDKVLRVPTADQDDEIARIVRSWAGSLHAYGLEISTGPVVPFRAVPFIFKSGQVPQTHAPLLWMQNVTSMQVEWPTEARGKEQYIVVNDSSRPLLLRNKNYVLLRRFSAKEARRRLIAAPLLASQMNSPFIGLENHLNYVHRPGGSLSEEEAYGLAVLLNSTFLDTYFRTFNGNTQVSATELRALPLPPLESIRKIGRRVMNCQQAPEEVDRFIAQAREPVLAVD